MGSKYTIDGSDAISKLGEARTAGMSMASASLSDLAEEVERVTFPLVPFDRGYLEDSFTYTSSKARFPMLGVEMWYSVEDVDGYDYAAIQHEEKDFYHPIRKAGKHPTHSYLYIGLMIVTPRLEDIVARNIRVVY